MAKPSQNTPPGIIRSTAVISLGLVALAGSIAASLLRRMTAPAGSNTPAPPISKLVMDEWESDLARLNLPTRTEVEALNQQIAELEAQIDQLIQSASQSKKGDI